eukprot:Skav203398  [mRNA]  locus=scaffold1947:7386:7874:+ [translate_table: standard]
MSLRPRCMTPWRCLWTVVLMAIHGKPVAAAPAQRHRTHSAVIPHRGVARRDRRNAGLRGRGRELELEAQRG